MQNKPHDKNYKTCGAKTRKGTPCLRPAGWGTDHPGEGKCKLHGGKSTGPKDKNKLKENKNAEKHGFFSKYLPEESLNIIQEIQDKDPIDILWDNIQIQYAAIIRSQKIMYVENKEEMIKELKKKKEYDSESISSLEVEYEFQFAWDRQATYLQAQSRAMAELRNMIKQYDELCKSDLATEEQKARIEKLKVDIEKVKGKDNDKPIEILIKRKGED
ncbi:phage terminase small subunit [Wansuia hejianensis]|uniref:Uncharacterized protein n=1 Tax=Wansuia hejianensis TaxID=2763667 RepID=A0A926EX81_9FIRM|nr:phage terminase small subunit [Wansuia hejianensis]MBC8590621.1 hypothetical protein [Wansuia hejianensis]